MYKYQCINPECNEITHSEYKTAWYTCKCNTYQSVGILCKCGIQFKPSENTWAYQCPDCERVVDANGRGIPQTNLIKCECCDLYFLKSNNCSTGGRETGLYKCPVSGQYVDEEGAIVYPKDICECEECMTEFLRTNCITKKVWGVGENAYYTCPTCRHTLDYTGHCVDLKKLDTCNNCNIHFGREHNASHPWLLSCPQCNNYVDEVGDIIPKQYIEECVCGTDYTTWNHEAICPICTRPKVTAASPAEICPNCGDAIKDDEAKLCENCGYLLGY